MAPTKSAGRVSIRVVPDSTRFRQDLQKSLERIERTLVAKIRAELYLDRQSLVKLKKQIEEIRRSHFVLGNEKVDYISHQHEHLSGAEVMSPAEIQAQLEKNRKLKQYLQRTNFVIGDDPDYS